MRHLSITAIVVLSLASFGIVASPFANASDIEVSYPTSPIPCGTTVTFSLVNRPSGYYVASIAWSYHYVFSTDCDDPWKPLGSPGSFNPSSYEGMPGTQKVRCQVTYGPTIPGNVPITETVIKDIVVAPPETAEVVSGNNVSTPVDTYCDTRYSVKSQGVGFNLSGFAQEYVYDAVVLGMPADPDAPGSTLEKWVPTSSSDPTYFKFQINGNTILDKKIWNTDGNMAFWNALQPLPFTLVTAKQKLRIRLADTCGNPLYYELSPVFNITMSKDTATTYTISHD